MANDTPAVASMKLARRLREMRIAAGMTGEAVALELLVSTSSVSRIETGDRAPTPRNVRDLCLLYGASDEEKAELMAATRLARQPDRWITGKVTSRSDLYLSLEQSAASVTGFAQDAIPALLRTADYDEAFGRPFPQLREARQALLEWAPSLFLLDEAVLRRHPGTAVMAAQLGHVLDLAAAGATVQVVLLAPARPPCPVANFTLLDFGGELPPMAFSERAGGYQDHSAELGYFQQQVDLLLDVALDLAESVKLIRKMRRSYLALGT